MRVIERHFSGYSLNIPEGLTLHLVTMSGKRVRFGDLDFWLRQRLSYFMQVADELDQGKCTEDELLEP